MKKPDVLQQVLEEYKLDAPLPGDVRKEMISSSAPVLKAVLKKHGKYGILVSMAVSVFFGIKRLGISLSLAKSSVVVSVAAAATAVTVVAGTTTGVVKIIIHEKASIEQGVIPEETIIQPKTPEEKPEPGPAVIKPSKKFENSIAIQSIELNSPGEDAAVAGRVRNKIKRELVRLRGRANILSSAASGSNMVLFGSIDKVDETYMLSVTVSNKTTGKVVYATLEKSKTIDGLNRACGKIAREISSGIK
ncbi:MAG: hypothetical protein GY754_43850 [bacterium]|nr:hypothetical protein [bacterium]